MWLVRCYNGKLYHHDETGKNRYSNRGLNIPAIHMNDVCRFTYECSRRTVSLRVNQTDLGVIFRDVPDGVAPVVTFYGTGRRY